MLTINTKIEINLRSNNAKETKRKRKIKEKNF